MTGSGNVQIPEPAANGKRRAAVNRLNKAHAKTRPNGRLNDSLRSAKLAAAMPKASWRVAIAAEVFAQRLQQARAAAESLALIGLAAAVLDIGGEVIVTNKLFADLMPDTVRELRGRPKFTDPTAARHIDDVISRICSGRRDGEVRSIPIRAQDGRPPTMVHVIPVPGGVNDPLPSTGAILVVTVVRPRQVPSPEILKGLFGLSPAEARVAHGIAAQRTVETIADHSGVSRETVRSQLKNVLAKTGTKRQVELAALLLGLPAGKV